MKRVFQHPPEASNGRKYWRSLGEQAETPEFKQWLQREFPSTHAEIESDGISRRNFLRLMGASVALAGFGMTGCRRPEAYIVPYTKSPEWIVPGKALQYATAQPRRRGAQPLLATSYEGRPTKLDGNHLFYKSGFSKVYGPSDTFGQVSILDLYDPDRLKEFRQGKEVKDNVVFFDALNAMAATFGDGEGVAFLADASNSPTRDRLRGELVKKFPKVRWVEFDPISDEAEVAASKAAFGGRYLQTPNWDAADILVTLDSDILDGDEGGHEAVRGFANGRRKLAKGEKMNRLYSVEGRLTTTGAAADHRLRIASTKIGAVALALATRLGVAGLPGSPVKLTEVQTKWIDELAADLLANKGKSIVSVGVVQPAAVHALGHMINDVLGNFGATITLMAHPRPESATLASLVQDVKDNKIKTLFVLNSNPVYSAPVDYDWATLQAKIPTVIALSHEDNETTQNATWVLPAAHYLESWGDAWGRDGTYMSTQPMILPLYNGLSEIELIARIIGIIKYEAPKADAPKSETPQGFGPELVQETFRRISKGTDFANDWSQFVHDGFLSGSAAPKVAPAFNAAGAAALASQAASAVLPDGAYEVVFYPSPAVDDGRYNNNGWVHELPDSITKLTWDNAALISPATAKKLGVPDRGSQIDDPYTDAESSIPVPVFMFTVDGKNLSVPVLVAPGQADETISIALGYGRTVVGRVGFGTGKNVYLIRSSSKPWICSDVKVNKTSETYLLAVTQEHGSMEGRGLIREASLDRFQKEPDFAHHIGIQLHGNKELYNNPQLVPGKRDIHQWGMVIDLSTCTGCTACIAACQAENNIPVVGKDQVIRGREMHWLRMDRYFSGDINDPTVASQPVGCQQCENAPCETVCPVNATIHSEDGLNVMAYNRCIGTRYCANNCPYKARRFNFFNYNERPLNELYYGPLAQKGSPETIKMQKNPNVTVRIRGVMEKCTFCVQRIEEAKITQMTKARVTDSPEHGNKSKLIPSDSIMTACQQVCAAEAIVFGNIDDPNSHVSKIRGDALHNNKGADPRNYDLLHYLNTKPRVTYQARIRNPNMKMPGAEIFLKDPESYAAPHHGHDDHAEPGHGAPEHSGHEAPVQPQGAQH
ncbi:MAG: TAT-variant-translocated molybdopterin oxidoreductase [Candidatus Methylacidiphilales bacterium]|nr:TAT-variant-translocated molybdopterin oxidoreductase [Candidatus Methylacidiphilales bacterium]